jgi:hypothetical protein
MSRTIKKKLTGAKAVSHQCRNNGTCPVCFGNRMYKNLKRMFNGNTNNTEQDSV